VPLLLEKTQEEALTLRVAHTKPERQAKSLMSDWLLSSDDESVELAAMRDKLRAMKEDDDEEASRKRKPPSLEDSASDDTSDASTSVDEAPVTKRSREDPFANQETLATNSAHTTTRRRPPETSSPGNVCANFYDDAESGASPPQKTGVDSAFNSSSLESPLPNPAKNSRQAVATTKHNDTEAAWHTSLEGDEAALDAALLSLEVEASYQMSPSMTIQDEQGSYPSALDASVAKFATTSKVVASSSAAAAADAGAAPHGQSAIPGATTKGRRTTTNKRGEAKQDDQDKRLAVENVPREEEKEEGDDDKEEDWVKELLRQEQRKVSEMVPTAMLEPEPYEPTPEDDWEDSFELPDAEEPSLDGDATVVADDMEGGDAWIQELLQQEEAKAQGLYEEPIAAFTPPLTQGGGSVDGHTQSLQDKYVDEAFGFTPSQKIPASTANTSQEIWEQPEVEVLEVPRRGGADQGSDGIDRDERYTEVDPSRYLAPPYRDRPPPLVHNFTANSHPPTHRRRLPVLEVFAQPQVASLFLAKFENFNPMQSELSNSLAHSDDHMVVAAPTGAGKTAVFEMAMARFFNVDLQGLGGNDRPSARGHYASQSLSPHRKIVYIAPSKALCEERFADWSKRMLKTKLGVDVATVTGDGDPGEAFRDIASAQLILTTPEKWDSITRRWTENFFLLATVKLVLVDEVHLLADASRGPCLEAILCRLKSIQRAAQNHVVSRHDIAASR
jgi:hypothetical protein